MSCCLVLLTVALPAAAQDRAADQVPQEGAPSERDNLVHAPGTRTVPIGTLGRAEIVGHGPRQVVFFPGFGLSGDLLRPFAEANRERYTMLLVTPAGFGHTPAPAMPAPGTRYKQRTWSAAVEQATWQLVQELGWERPVLAGHIGGFQHALRLAVDHPDEVAALVSLSGELVRDYGEGFTPEERADGIDERMAENWFKTVNDTTWRQGMGNGSWHSADEALGQELFEASLVPSIPTQVRYFVEKWSLDERGPFVASGVPTLALLPDAQSNPDDPMFAMFVGMVLDVPWRNVADAEHIRFELVEGARLGMLRDHIPQISQAMAAFLEGLD
jgi:pimeloyl-ACP methyl ester carboxylesterase